MFLNSDNKLFYDDRYIRDPASSGSLINGVELTVPCIVAVAAPTREQKGIIIAGDTASELQQHAVCELEGKASMLSPPFGGVDALLLELCASKNF